MRPLSLHGLLAALLLASPVARAAEGEPWSCHDPLTFRWAAPGEAPEPGLGIAGDLDGRSPAFLADPKILSVTPGRDAWGPRIEIRFGADPAAILARETRDHAGETMIIMMGPIVLASPRVMGQLGDGRVVALTLAFEEASRDRLVAALQGKAGDCAPVPGRS
jgi:hypothetical protein